MGPAGSRLPALRVDSWLEGLLVRRPRDTSPCRAEHAKENGLLYQSPGLANGIKLSPQDLRPSSPGALQMAGERSGEKVRAGLLCWGCWAGPEPGGWQGWPGEGDGVGPAGKGSGGDLALLVSLPG